MKYSSRELATGRESAQGTLAEPVDVDADVLDGREGVAVVGLEHADLSRQARGALSKHRQAGVPAGPTRRSSGSCMIWVSLWRPNALADSRAKKICAQRAAASVHSSNRGPEALPRWTMRGTPRADLLLPTNLSTPCNTFNDIF